MAQSNATIIEGLQRQIAGYEASTKILSAAVTNMRAELAAKDEHIFKLIEQRDCWQRLYNIEKGN